MSTYGRQVLGTTGIPVRVSADGSPEYKPGGITLDWATVTAAASDTTLNDGTVIATGKKGLEYGTILAAKVVSEVQSVTVTGSPTGGTYTLEGNGDETAAIAYNAAASVVQTAIRSLGGSYAGATVTGNAGGPYTVTFGAGTGDVAALVLGDNSLTGGTTPGVTIATGTAGSATGTFGPYDPDATDGRQTLARGYCFILDETVLEEGANGLIGVASAHPAVFEGGLVWKSRLKVGGEDQPSWAAFEAAFPRIRYAMD